MAARNNLLVWQIFGSAFFIFIFTNRHDVKTAGYTESVGISGNYDVWPT